MPLNIIMADEPLTVCMMRKISSTWSDVMVPVFS